MSNEVAKRKGTAFISGTVNVEKTKAMEKKLRYIGYNTVAVLVGKPDENRKKRLEALMTCDDIFFYSDVTGRDHPIWDFEKVVANYLGMKIYTEDDLNRMVAEMVIADPPEEPVAPLKVGDDSKDGSMAEPE